MSDMDVFQSAPLGSLNFDNEPRNRDLDITTSFSLDTLIEQNDDLTMKLKTALRRLSNLETEYANSSEENLKLRTAFSQMQDQIFVYKEEKESTLRQNQKDRELMAGIEREVNVLRLQIQRYQKYHEKVKTQVKPYVQELKNYAAQLEVDIKTQINEKLAVEKELNKKESLAQDLRDQIRELIRNAQGEMEEQTKKFEAMVDYFEGEMKSREKIYSEQKELMADLEIKIQMLGNIKKSRDLMENHMIELEKSKDDLGIQFTREIKEIKAEREFLHLERSRLEIELKDLKSKYSRDTKDRASLETKNRELTAQIDSLRTLWNDQQVEIERVRKSQEALERLNLELSQKLANPAR